MLGSSRSAAIPVVESLRLIEEAAGVIESPADHPSRPEGARVSSPARLLSSSGCSLLGPGAKLEARFLIWLRQGASQPRFPATLRLHPAPPPGASQASLRGKLWRSANEIAAAGESRAALGLHLTNSDYRVSLNDRSWPRAEGPLWSEGWSKAAVRPVSNKPVIPRGRSPLSESGRPNRLVPFGELLLRA